ncbi:MAG: hypothetical protein ACOC9X_01065 [bacterium]|nr:hypothetical protein [Candidatus Sulfomarinibacteraceae bacterium]
MTVTAIVHVANEEPIVCELEELPKAGDQLVTLTNPRRRDGKDLHYLEEDVNKVVIPWHRISFVQVLPSGEVEDVIGFVRE